MSCDVRAMDMNVTYGEWGGVGWEGGGVHTLTAALTKYVYMYSTKSGAIELYMPGARLVGTYDYKCMNSDILQFVANRQS